MDLSELLEVVRAWPPWVTYAALFFGALVEYIFPPFPGDTLVVAGAVLVTAFGWALWPVLALVTAGAVLGAVLDYKLGLWLRRGGRLERLRPSWREALDGVVRQFSRRGAWYLAVNRFVPGIRAFFFIAAGVAELRLVAVVFWATLSALAWNGLLLALGGLLGEHLDELEALIANYTLVVWLIVGLVLAVVVWRLVRKGRARPGRGDGGSSGRAG